MKIESRGPFSSYTYVGDPTPTWSTCTYTVPAKVETFTRMGHLRWALRHLWAAVKP